MSNENFELEERYIVVKLKDADSNQEQALREFLQSYQIPTRECVVSEMHHPSFPICLDAIARAATGKPQITEEINKIFSGKLVELVEVIRTGYPEHPEAALVAGCHDLNESVVNTLVLEGRDAAIKFLLHHASELNQ